MGTRKAAPAVTELPPVDDFRNARSEAGNVRPADDRYLSDEALDARDAYVLAKSGPDAQQLVARREEIRAVLDQADEGTLADLADGLAATVPVDDPTRVQVTQAVVEAIADLPRAEAAVHLDLVNDAVAAEAEADAVTTGEGTLL